MVLGRVASANTACSASRVSTRARTRSSSGPSAACRLALTSFADQPAVALPSTKVAAGEAGVHLGNVGRGQDIGDGQDHAHSRGQTPFLCDRGSDPFHIR